MLFVLSHHRESEDGGPPKLIKSLNEEITLNTTVHYAELPSSMKSIVVTKNNATAKKRFIHPRLRDLDELIQRETEQRKSQTESDRRKFILENELEEAKLLTMEKEIQSRLHQSAKDDYLNVDHTPIVERPKLHLQKQEIQVPRSRKYPSSRQVRALERHNDLLSNAHSRADNKDKLISTDQPRHVLNKVKSRVPARRTRQRDTALEEQMSLLAKRRDEASNAIERIRDTQPASPPSPLARKTSRRGYSDEFRPLASAPSSPGSTSHRSMSSVDDLLFRSTRTSPTNASRRSSSFLADPSISFELESTTSNEDSSLITKSKSLRMATMKRRLQKIQETIQISPESETSFIDELEYLKQQIEDLAATVPFQQSRSQQPQPKLDQLDDPVRHVVPGTFSSPPHRPERESEKNSPSPALAEKREILEEHPLVTEHDVEQTKPTAISEQPQILLLPQENVLPEAPCWVYPTYDWSSLTRGYIIRVLERARNYLSSADIRMQTDNEWSLIIPSEVFQAVEDDITAETSIRQHAFYQINKELDSLKRAQGLPQQDYTTPELIGLTEVVYINIVRLYDDQSDLYKLELLDFTQRLLKYSIRNFNHDVDNDLPVIADEDYERVEAEYRQSLSGQRYALFLAINEELVEVYPGLLTNFECPDGISDLKSFLKYSKRPLVEKDVFSLADELYLRLTRFDCHQAPGYDISVQAGQEIGDMIGRCLVLEEQDDWNNFHNEESSARNEIGAIIFERLLQEVDEEVARVTSGSRSLCTTEFDEPFLA